MVAPIMQGREVHPVSVGSTCFQIVGTFCGLLSMWMVVLSRPDGCDSGLPCGGSGGAPGYGLSTAQLEQPGEIHSVFERAGISSGCSIAVHEVSVFVRVGAAIVPEATTGMTTTALAVCRHISCQTSVYGTCTGTRQLVETNNRLYPS